jgi:hypothetical protein
MIFKLNSKKDADDIIGVFERNRLTSLLLQFVTLQCCLASILTGVMLHAAMDGLKAAGIAL